MTEEASTETLSDRNTLKRLVSQRTQCLLVTACAVIGNRQRLPAAAIFPRLPDTEGGYRLRAAAHFCNFRRAERKTHAEHQPYRSGRSCRLTLLQVSR